MKAELDERGLRCWAANEALELGHGGIKAVAQATGLGKCTVLRGCKDICQGSATIGYSKRRIRHPGGGRKLLSVIDPGLVAALEALVSPATRGDPMSPLRWTCKSTRKLAKALADQGHKVSHTRVAQLWRIWAIVYRVHVSVWKRYRIRTEMPNSAISTVA